MKRRSLPVMAISYGVAVVLLPFVLARSALRRLGKRVRALSVVLALGATGAVAQTTTNCTCIGPGAVGEFTRTELLADAAERAERERAWRRAAGIQGVASGPVLPLSLNAGAPAALLVDAQGRVSCAPDTGRNVALFALAGLVAGCVLCGLAFTVAVSTRLRR